MTPDLRDLRLMTRAERTALLAERGREGTVRILRQARANAKPEDVYDTLLVHDRTGVPAYLILDLDGILSWAWVTWKYGSSVFDAVIAEVEGERQTNEVD